MSLVDEIIDLLSDQNKLLTEALLKTKVLLHKLGHKELVEWVNYELNGYPNEDAVPEYRVLHAQVMASLMNRAYHVARHPIPLGHLTESQRAKLESVRMDQSLAVLEKLAEKHNGHLEANIPMEANGILGQGLANGYQIQRAWCETGQAQVSQIFVQVRSRLLDFVLELKDQLGEGASDKEMQDQAGNIDARGLFNNAIFGNNTTIVVGDNNKQNVSTVINIGNFEELANVLRKENMAEQDIGELKAAIKKDADSQEHQEKKFGPSVRSWLQVMLSKAVDASWQIELSVAGSLLATALQRYYGW